MMVMMVINYVSTPSAMETPLLIRRCSMYGILHLDDVCGKC